MFDQIDLNWKPADLLKVSSGAWAACAIQAGVELDIFTALDQAPGATLTITELAAKIKGDARATGMLATALTALNLLERKGDQVTATPPARRYLSARSDDYYGFFIRHAADIMHHWVNLARAVRTGASVAEVSPPDTYDERERENFLMGMFNIARQQADIVAGALDLSGRHRLLDLGGGPGTYAIYFCRRYPELSATIFDRPTTAKFAQGTVERYGLAARVDFVGGDFLTSELPRGYDAVWLSQVLHGENPAEAAGLIERAAGTLNPGGLLCVQEFIIDDDRRGPVQPALFALNMLVQTPGGQAYTESEISAMMARAGAAGIRRIKADLPPGCGIMVGEKG